MSNQTDMAAKEMRMIKMLERIEDYIFGKLNQEEFDALWIDFLKVLEWLDYLLIELKLRSHFRENSPISAKITRKCFLECFLNCFIFGISIKA